MAQIKPLQTEGLLEEYQWEKPERKDQAGSLVIFGGASLKLKEVDSIYKSAVKKGVGQIQTLVPESLAKSFKRDFNPLVPIKFDGYFGLTEEGAKTLQEEVAMSDATIIADVGKSSATHLTLAKILPKSFKPIIITSSAVSFILNFTEDLLGGPSNLLVLDLQNFQRLIKVSKISVDYKLSSNSPLARIIESLHKFQSQVESKVIVITNNIAIASSGNTFFSTRVTNQESLIAGLATWSIWSPEANLTDLLYLASSG